MTQRHCSLESTSGICLLDANTVTHCVHCVQWDPHTVTFPSIVVTLAAKWAGNIMEWSWMGSCCRSFSFFIKLIFDSCRRSSLPTNFFFFFLNCVSACSFMQQMHLVCCLEGENLRHQEPHSLLLNPLCCLSSPLMLLLHSFLHPCGVWIGGKHNNRNHIVPPIKRIVFCRQDTKPNHLFNCCLKTLPVNWHHVPVYDQLINVLLSPYFILCFYLFYSREVFRALLFVLENSWGTLSHWYAFLVCVCVRACTPVFVFGSTKKKN